LSLYAFNLIACKVSSPSSPSPSASCGLVPSNKEDLAAVSVFSSATSVATVSWLSVPVMEVLVGLLKEKLVDEPVEGTGLPKPKLTGLLEALLPSVAPNPLKLLNLLVGLSDISANFSCDEKGFCEFVALSAFFTLNADPPKTEFDAVAPVEPDEPKGLGAEAVTPKSIDGLPSPRAEADEFPCDGGRE
jgi:hypothetical protein